MNQLKVEINALRPAVCSDVPTTLDVLIKIVPPETNEKVKRPPINLGLVLDRSGSMAAHNRIAYAREAAVFAVQQLLPSDRVSVTTFDSRVQRLIPNTLAENKRRIIELIRGITTGGSTALHAGWTEGAEQVGRNLLAGGLNRVILLSDGLANVGERNPDTIASHVRRLVEEGVSTTALGVGDQFNEDLLKAMADAGDGNFEFIESPKQLPTIFQKELKELAATFGTKVSLGIETPDDVKVVDVLNDFDELPSGRFKLPNLWPVRHRLVVRLKVRPRTKEGEVCRLRLAWNSPKVEGRQEIWSNLSLPVVDAVAWGTLASNVEVQEAPPCSKSRLKKKINRCLDQGDGERAAELIETAVRLLTTAPATPEVLQEQEDLALLLEHHASGDWPNSRKHAAFQAHRRQKSKP